MDINIKSLDECPKLTEYEKDLIRRINIKVETQASVAKLYKKNPSTISLQRKKALKKFTAWMQNREKKEAASLHEDFDKQVFRLLNRNWTANRIIEKLGNPERVVELVEIHRQNMQDDYYKACEKVAEAGWKIDENSRYPLTTQIDNIVSERDSAYFEKEEVLKYLKEAGVNCNPKQFDVYGSVLDAVKSLAEDYCQAKNKLREAEATNRMLELVKDRLSKQIEPLRSENAELSKLEKYEGLTDEQIQARRETIRELDNQRIEIIREQDSECTQLRVQKKILEGEIVALTQIKTELETDIQGVISRCIAKLRFDDLVRLWTNSVKSNLWTTLIAQ